MTIREGSLEAPTRHPLDWRNPDFHDEASLNRELARIFDICHGCRRCVSLCNAFPTLFDLVDASKTGEVEGSKVFDLYQAGKLAEIREYNLNDVRVTRKVYERMVACFGP